MNALRVLRQVTDPVLISQIEEDSPTKILSYDDGTSWVDVDHPWDVNLSMQIAGDTGKFRVADEGGGWLAGPYNSLEKAIKAKGSAKVVTFAEVEGLEDEAAEVATKTAASNTKSVAALGFAGGGASASAV